MLYFRANDGITGFELWMHDSLSDTTTLVDIAAGCDSSRPLAFIDMDDTLYVTADDAAQGRELWSYHPSRGAIMVADTNPYGSGLSGHGELKVAVPPN